MKDPKRIFVPARIIISIEPKISAGYQNDEKRLSVGIKLEKSSVMMAMGLQSGRGSCKRSLSLTI